MYALAVAIRAGSAIVFGVLFGILGLLVSDWTYPGLVAPMWLMVMMVGVFAGVRAQTLSHLVVWGEMKMPRSTISPLVVIG